MRDRIAARPWQPPAETLETIAGTLRAHWLATRVRPERPFWPEAADWLHGQAVRLTPESLFRQVARQLEPLATGDAVTGAAAP